MKGSRARYTIVLGTLSLVLAVSLGEMVVRFAGGDMDYALEMWRYAHVLKRVTDDRAQVFAHRPGASAHLMGVDVRINSEGLRNREVRVKPVGTRRVLLLGDSLTFGWGVKEEESIGPQLERALATTDPRQPWEVINSGVGNYNTRLEVHFLEQQGLRYAPDVVVLNYYINDAEEDPRYSGTFLSEHSALWVFLANRLDVLARLAAPSATWEQYYAGLYRPEATGWRGAREALGHFGALCREHQLHCLVAHLPELHRLRPYPFLAETRLVEQATREAGLPFVDLLPVVQERDPASLWVSRQDVHPNGACDALYGAALARAIASTGAPK